MSVLSAFIVTAPNPAEKVANTVSTSPMSGSTSLASTAMVTLAFSVVDALSVIAIGASFAPVMVTVAVAEALPPRPSLVI